MHLFDTSDPGVVATRWKFWVTLGVLAGATYVFAGLAIWLIWSRKSTNPVKADVKKGPKEKRFDGDGSTNKETKEHEKRGKGGGLGFLRKRKDRSLQEQSTGDTNA